MNISILILTKFKYLFNKIYQKWIPKSELKDKKEAECGKKYSSIKSTLFLRYKTSNLKLPASSPLNNINNP